MWRRRVVIAMVLLVHTCIMWMLATMAVYVIVFGVPEGVPQAISFLLHPREWDIGDEAWWITCGIPVLLLVATQAVFIWPLRGGVVRSQPDGKPLKRMIVVAGFVGAVMSFVLVFGLAATVQLIWAMVTQRDPESADLGDVGNWLALVVTIILLVGSWIFWSILLSRFAARQDARTRFSRVVGLLFAGTVVETMVVLPIDIMLRRRTDCYCSTGTFYSLCLSSWALLWLAGPGAFLALTSKRRRAWATGHCVRCGYAKGPSPARACPECGHDWSDSPAHASTTT